MTDDKDLLKYDKQRSEDLQVLLDEGLLPYEIQTVREIVDEFDGDKLDQFNDGIIYRAYYAAKHCKSLHPGVIAKQLGISRKLLDFYLQRYPKLGLAIQTGYNDARDLMQNDLVSALYQLGMGMQLKDVKVTDNDLFTADGEQVGHKRETTTTLRQVAPNVTAALELLKRLDPAWQTQVNVNVNESIQHNFHVIDDVSVAVDYRKLSPTALKELIAANKNPRSDLLEKEDGGSTHSDHLANMAAQHAANNTEPAKQNQRKIGALKQEAEALKQSADEVIINKPDKPIQKPNDTLIDIKPNRKPTEKPKQGKRGRPPAIKIITSATKQKGENNEKRKRGRPKKS